MKAYFKCKECGEDYRDHNPYRSYPETHDKAKDKPMCVSCGQDTLEWIVERSSGISDYTFHFDFAHQVFRNLDGTIKLDRDENHLHSDHTCPRCLGPASIVSFNSYYELHKCNRCNHEFKVS